MSAPAEIHGTCDARFLRVREAFAENFGKRHDLGAAVCVLLEGRPVVDLWGGWTDRKHTAPWRPDTLANVYSTSKGLTALLAHRLADLGKLDLDAPVARLWPEFAQKGKEKITLTEILSHRAGLPAIRGLMAEDALFDFGAMARALAGEEPWWEPGTKHGYHAVTYGWLVGEPIRRTCGKSVGEAFGELLAGPLGADAYIGLPESLESRAARMAQMSMKEAQPSEKDKAIVEKMLKEPRSMTGLAFMNPPAMARPGVVNSRQWRAAQIPAANAQVSARGLAALYGAAANRTKIAGRPFLSEDQLTRCQGELARGEDLVLPITTRFGPGFMLPQDFDGGRMGKGRHCFGHPGAGGSLGFADPDARLGFGYVMNHMGMAVLIDRRPTALANALYECL